VAPIAWPHKHHERDDGTRPMGPGCPDFARIKSNSYSRTIMNTLCFVFIAMNDHAVKFPRGSE